MPKVKSSPMNHERKNAEITSPLNIIWVVTEPLDFRQEKQWEQVEKTAEKLIRFIGNTKYTHETASPRLLMPILVEKLRGEHFSTIVNIASPTFSHLLRKSFPKIPIIHFPISRVRDAEKIETLGYQIGLSVKQIDEMVKNHDLSHTLLFDDVGHTGGTQYMVMKLLDIDPKTATHGFLLANTGIYEGKPAIVGQLQNMGASVVYARSFASPGDKIWHVEDIHGGKRKRWQEQVNPLLAYQDRFTAHINPNNLSQATPLINILNEMIR